MGPAATLLLLRPCLRIQFAPRCQQPRWAEFLPTPRGVSFPKPRTCCCCRHRYEKLAEEAYIKDKSLKFASGRLKGLDAQKADLLLWAGMRLMARSVQALEVRALTASAAASCSCWV